MPTRLSYNDSRLIPAPLVSINRSFQTTGDGTKIGSVYNIVLNGTIVVDMGSPNSAGVFWTTGGYPANEVIPKDSRLGAILRKQEAIRKLFSKDGLSLEIQSADGSPPLKCYPRVVSNEDQQGIWFNLETYSITLEADKLYLGSEEIGDDFEEYISSANETWSINQEEGFTQDFPPTFRISHTVTATGKRFFEDNTLSKPAWQQAKEWVKKRLGLSSIILSGVNHIPDYYGGYNHMVSDEIGELDGTFSSTETWILSSGISIEEFEINTVASVSDPYRKVSINGSVRGLENRLNGVINTSRIQNAEITWSGIKNNIYDRAYRYSNENNLNPIPLQSTVGKNIMQGVISYNYEYDTRPANNISETKSESIRVSDSNNVDLFAIIPVPFRATGPIIQDIFTKREKTRTVNIEFFVDYNVGNTVEDRFITNHPENRSPQSGQIQHILDTLRPNNSKVSENNYDWDGSSRYYKTVSWVYE